MQWLEKERQYDLHDRRGRRGYGFLDRIRRYLTVIYPDVFVKQNKFIVLESSRPLPRPPKPIKSVEEECPEYYCAPPPPVIPPGGVCDPVTCAVGERPIYDPSTLKDECPQYV